jgi:hypothetical protein
MPNSVRICFLLRFVVLPDLETFRFCALASDLFLLWQVSPLAHSAVRTIPAMLLNGGASFEFSAVPSLLQRFPAPSHLLLLDSHLSTSATSVLPELGEK